MEVMAGIGVEFREELVTEQNVNLRNDVWSVDDFVAWFFHWEGQQYICLRVKQSVLHSIQSVRVSLTMLSVSSPVSSITFVPSSSANLLPPLKARL